jgi:Fe-S-cluster containining protein
LSAPPIPACLNCGACCFGAGARYVRVSGDDHARLGDAAEDLTLFIDNRCYMRMHEGHCVALAIRGDGTFFCGAYEQRPSVCRELARGSGECQAELTLKRSTSQRALLRVI